MSKALIVYATKTGCTEGIAKAIAETLRERGVEADVRRADEKPELKGYDAVFVGSGVRVGQWHAAAKQWTTGNAALLKQLPLAFFTTCLTLASDPEKTDEVRAFTDPLITETGLEPVALGLFAGMNLPKTFSLPERLIMKAMKAPEGDFRDYDAVADWARETAPALGL